MRTHMQVIAWIHIVSGALCALGGLALLFLFLGIGSFAAAGGGKEALPAFGILGSVGVFASLFFGVVGLPDILAGWGMLQRRNWARILAIVLSVLNVFNFPLGTAIAVYSFVVLFNQDVAREFS